MDKIALELGKIIVFHRNNKGLSQEMLAHTAKIHRTYVSQIERGLKHPTINVLFQISFALGIPLSQIIKELEERI